MDGGSDGSSRSLESTVKNAPRMNSSGRSGSRSEKRWKICPKTILPTWGSGRRTSPYTCEAQSIPPASATAQLRSVARGAFAVVVDPVGRGSSIRGISSCGASLRTGGKDLKGSRGPRAWRKPPLKPSGELERSTASSHDLARHALLGPARPTPIAADFPTWVRRRLETAADTADQEVTRSTASRVRIAGIATSSGGGSQATLWTGHAACSLPAARLGIRFFEGPPPRNREGSSPGHPCLTAVARACARSLKGNTD